MNITLIAAFLVSTAQTSDSQHAVLLLSRLAKVPSDTDYSLLTFEEFVRLGYDPKLRNNPVAFATAYLGLKSVTTSAFTTLADAISVEQEAKSGSEWSWRRVPKEKWGSLQVVRKALNGTDIWNLERKLVLLFWLVFDYSRPGLASPWERREAGWTFCAPSATVSGFSSSYSIVIPTSLQFRKIKRRKL